MIDLDSAMIATTFSILAGLAYSLGVVFTIVSVVAYVKSRRRRQSVKSFEDYRRIFQSVTLDAYQPIARGNLVDLLMRAYAEDQKFDTWKRNPLAPTNVEPSRIEQDPRRPQKSNTEEIGKYIDKVLADI